MTSLRLILRTVTALAIVGATATGVSAQVSATFADLPRRLDIGDQVTVWDSQGTRVHGRLLGLTPDQIVVGDARAAVTLAGDRVRQVGRCCDSVKNGALIGGLVWGTLGFLAGLNFADRTEVGAGVFLGGVFFGLGAGLGAGVDALIRNDVVVYRAHPLQVGLTSLTPGRGLTLTVRF